MKRKHFLHWIFVAVITIVLLCTAVFSVNAASDVVAVSPTDGISALPEGLDEDEDFDDDEDYDYVDEEDFDLDDEKYHAGNTYFGERRAYCDSKWLLDETTDTTFDNSIEEDVYEYMPVGEVNEIHTADSVLDIYGRYIERDSEDPCIIRVCIGEDVYTLNTYYYAGDYLTIYNECPQDAYADAFYGELSTKQSGNVPVRVYAINSIGEKFCVYNEEMYFDTPEHEKELCGSIETMEGEGTECHITGYAYDPDNVFAKLVIAVRISMEDMSDEKVIYLGEASKYSDSLTEDSNYLSLTDKYSYQATLFNHGFDITVDVEEERGFRVVSVYALYDFDLENGSEDYYENNRTVLAYDNFFFENLTYEIEKVYTTKDGIPCVTGWAFDNDNLDGGFRIKFVIEDNEYAALNCEYRDDIKSEYGLVSNQCGFTYKAYTCTCTPGLHTLSVYISISGGMSDYEYYLLVCEEDVRIPKKNEHLDAKANQIGSITIKDNKNDTVTVSGWVQDPDSTSSQLYVAVSIGLLSDSFYVRDGFYTTSAGDTENSEYGTIHKFSKTYDVPPNGNTLFEVYAYDYQYEKLGNYPSWYTPCPPNLTLVHSETICLQNPLAYVWKTSDGEKTKVAYYNIDDALKAAVNSSQNTYNLANDQSEEYTIKFFTDIIGDNQHDIVTKDMRDYEYASKDEDISEGITGGSGFIYLTQCSVCFDLNGHTIDRGYTYSDVTIVGCCIYVDTGANLTIKNGTITGGHQSSRSGGGIHVNDGNLTMYNVTMAENYTYNCGGAIYCEVTDDLAYNFGYINLIGCNFNGNYADDEGGAVYMDSGTLNMSNTTVIGNSADDCGGGIYMNSGVATLSNDNIVFNYVNNDEGGAIYLEEDSTVRVNDCYIRNNCASLTDNDEGGGIYVEDNSILELSGTNYIRDNYFYKDCNAFTYIFDEDPGEKFENNVCAESTDATIRSCGINTDSKIGILFEDEDDSGAIVENVLEREATVFKADLGSCHYINTGTVSEVYYEASAFSGAGVGVTIGLLIFSGCFTAIVIYNKKRKKDENESK